MSTNESIELISLEFAEDSSVDDPTNSVIKPAASRQALMESRAKMRWIVWDDGDIGTAPEDGSDYSGHIANCAGYQSVFLIDSHNGMIDEIDELKAELKKAREELERANTVIKIEQDFSRDLERAISRIRNSMS